MRWALIGASDVSERRMLPALRAAGERATRIYSSNLERARRYAARHDVEQATSDLARALDEGVDAVYVSSANQHHAVHVLAAAGAGRHVLCEKPLALAADDAFAMVETCQRNGVILGTNHHLRGSEVLRELSRQVVAGTIGELRSARVQNAIALSERLRTWRISGSDEGGGVAFDLAVHDIDALRFVLGRELVEVTALAASQALGADGVEDVLVSAHRYDADVMAVAHEAYTVPFTRTLIEVHGSAGSLTAIDALRPDSVGRLRLLDGDGERLIELAPSEGMYVRTVRDFCRAVNEGGSPAATGVDGVKSLLGALALRESAVTGQSVSLAPPELTEQEPTR